jgi:hypothetical protein
MGNEIQAVVACVNYDDFLRRTLPATLHRIPRVTVLTSPDDFATIDLAVSNGANFMTTDAWKHGRFNKARALNDWLRTVLAIDPHSWLLAMDADILLPPGPPLSTERLDARALYGAKRRMCESEGAWSEYARGTLPFESFDLESIPIEQGMMWGYLPTSNPAGLVGYFQLWNPGASHVRHFMESGTAADYDVTFGLSFPDESRRYFPGLEVLHLGTCRENWAGRKSARWSCA